jgi:glycosyltransferase involved in cell wall biosynthesis
VESVINQTFQEFEYIIIDGGSTDGSFEYIEKNKELFAFWISELDSGVYQAMNKGIQKASGDYILFLNSGDHFYNDDTLAIHQKELTGQDLVYFNIKVVEASKTFIKNYPDTLSFSYFVKDTLPHPGTFIKKDLFNSVGMFKEDFKIVSDWKFFLDAVCKHQASYKHVNKTLSVFYLDGVSSDATNSSIIFKEKQQVLKSSYAPFLQDIEDVITYKDILTGLKKSRIIQWLVRLGFLNKF